MTTNQQEIAKNIAMAKELEALRLENAKLKQDNAPKQGIGLKVSEKGALSVYGMGRFPVTLYKTQWTKLLEQSAQILAFIAAHPELKDKAAK